ncbi:hypothetical protein CQ018_13725 [Arthrobacter sp. MYb227]|nr:hypothetical protein CQ018_13725 [Arthrobacter sp. MYb227]
MNSNPEQPDLVPITKKDFATTLRVLRTLEEFQRVQNTHVAHNFGLNIPRESIFTPAISSVIHFSEFLPQIVPSGQNYEVQETK